MRVSTLDFFQQAMANFTQQQLNINNTQSQISSGNSILTPADDPIGAMQTLNYRVEVSKYDQFLSNVDSAQSSLEYEDAILAAVTSIYQRIKELTVQAGNAGLNNMDRSAIAAEMTERLAELQGLANTRAANGDYIFAGYTLNHQPVETDNQGNYIFQGDDGQRTMMLAESTLVAISDSGKNIFFSIPTDRVVGNSLNGYVSVTGAAGSLVTAGTLSKLNVNDLTLNNIPIPASMNDTVSTSDASASAISIAAAINSQTMLHGVEASVNPTSVNLGIYTPSTLTVNQFSINGVPVIDNVGTEASLLLSINTLTDQTGVTASQPGGAGTAILLAAADGRNVQLQTSGGSIATFANFNMTATALNEVMSSTVTLRCHHPMMIGGAFPSHAGLTRGTYNVVSNTGTGIISEPVIIGNVPNPSAKYSIVFNAGGTTFNIVDDSNPTQPLTGFANVPYVQGAAIQFNGISVNITGSPNSGDVFAIELETLATQDIFTSLTNLINGINGGTLNSEQLSYVIGLGLDNLSSAEDILMQTRAQVGARLNIVDSQKNFNNALQLIAQENLSNVADLDYSKAITELTQYTFTLEAAQKSFVKIQSLSLFNFLR